MHIKRNVVMLPTNEKANIDKGQLYLISNKKGNIDDSLISSKLFIAFKHLDYEDRQNIIFCYGGDVYLKSQHLYILSDEEIKEGDEKCWAISKPSGRVYQIGNVQYAKQDGDRKIIATTDKSLKDYGGGVDKIMNDFNSTFADCLPQPSQSFIEKFVEEYNKGNIITEVMVEYEPEIAMDGHTVVGSDLKTNPDNTLSIKPVKDSWSREEVIGFGLKVLELGFDLAKNPLPRLNEQSGKDYYYKWIEENL